MLESTFVFLNGIGHSTERRFWDVGVADWKAFLTRPALPGISPQRKAHYDEQVASAMKHFDAGDSAFFAGCLKSRDHWRLFQTFRPRTLYLDIETTGGPPSDGEVTVVGLYSSGVMTSLIRGENLTGERLNEVFAQHDLLVTFFGSGFDVPYLRAKFPDLSVRLPHFDLCFAARRLGLRGGLKYIERACDIDRDTALQGLDGWDAVRLWHRWENGEIDALDLLLRYNAADTQNLEPLAARIYEELALRYGPPSI